MGQKNGVSIVDKATARLWACLLCVDDAARTLMVGVATDKADRGVSCLLRSLAETEGGVCYPKYANRHIAKL